MTDVKALWAAVYGPFMKGARADLQNGLALGDAESKRIVRDVMVAYGGLDKVPAEFALETAGAALELVGRSHELVALWTAHAGFDFALAAFVASLGSRQRHAARWGTTYEDRGERSLASLLSERADRALATQYAALGDAARAAARAKAAELREGRSLLARSAIASALLDVEWLDADLAEHARTKERAIVSPDALLVLTNVDALAAYLASLTIDDLYVYTQARPFMPVPPPTAKALAARPAVAAALAVAFVRVEPTQWGVARELLAAAPKAKGDATLLAAAVVVIDRAEAQAKLTKAEDPRPVAYAILRGSPAIALPLVAAKRGAWAKGLAAELERIAGPPAEVDPEAEAVSDSDVPAVLRAAHRFKSPSWLIPAALPRLALVDDGVLPARYVPALCAVFADGDRSTLTTLAKSFDRASLAAFGWALFQAWLTSDAPSKDKWAFTALGAVGNDDTAKQVAALVRVWPGEGQHKRAVAGLDVLAGIGSDLALVLLDGIGHKVSYRALQDAARAKLGEIATARGLSVAELGDRLVPELGLDARGERTFAVGDRTLRIVFDERLAPGLVDAATAKPVATLPKAASESITAAWKTLRTDAKAVGTIQLLRLELAMGAARRWRGADARRFIFEHPLLRHVAARLVWGVYVPGARGALQRTFHAFAPPAIDELADGAQIGIVHRVHLTDDQVRTHLASLRERELAQPFEQLARRAYRATALDVMGSTVETPRLLGLLSRGWRKGPVEDAGWITTFVKPVGDAETITLEFGAGIQAQRSDYVEAQTLGNLVLDRPLAQYPDEVISELVRDLDSIGALTAS